MWCDVFGKPAGCWNKFRELLRFQNQQTLSCQSRLFTCLSLCHPELVSGSCFWSYPRTALHSAQRVFVLKRIAVLRTGCWNKFSMTNYRVFRISRRCHTRHDFLDVPLIVIPNLFRDPGFWRPWPGVGSWKDQSETVSPLNGSPFSEKNGCKFLDASCEKKKENLFLKGY